MKTTITILSFFISFLCVNAQSSDRDKRFIEEGAQGGLMEVKLGELAQAKAVAPEVKTLGRQMITDHSRSNDSLAALAARKNVTFPTTLSEKGQATYDMLAEKQGADFDKAYAKCMVKDHKKDIREFKEEAKKGDDVDLKGYASAMVPILHHHKHMAKYACKALKKNKTQVNARLAAANK